MKLIKTNSPHTSELRATKSFRSFYCVNPIYLQLKGEF